MSDRVDWVTARGRCQIADTFNEIANAVNNDVKAFNEMTDIQRADRFFDCKPHGDSWIVQRAKDTGFHGKRNLEADPDHALDRILIHHNTDTIIAERGSRLRIDVKPKWNESTLTCDLFVGEKSLPLWHVCQMILGDFMFGDD